jgi:protein involved in ribonucleotide reduction
LLVVYFSSVSGNTKRFVEKLDLPVSRIPLYRSDEELIVNVPYVLAVPSYGGGAQSSNIPKQVIKFLRNENNRQLMRGVIALGNTNFGHAYCIAGHLISQKLGVPVLAEVEIFGTLEDVTEVKQKIEELGEKI